MNIRHATILLALLACFGCTRKEPPAAKAAGIRAGQKSFESADAAVGALVDAVRKSDQAELAAILGPGSEGVLDSGDAIADSTARVAFLAKYEEKHVLAEGGPDDLVLTVGTDDWPFPIPIVRREGKWILDGAAGAEEIVKRRIGGNELRTIDVMHGFVGAQEEYASASHDGVPAGTYARAIRSTAGKQDGLYWDAAKGMPESPAGPFLADATAEGYEGAAARGEPYHGYRFKPLTAQGDDAEGGARDYVVDGRLSGGFGLVAWPASYGTSGVMTFVVNQDGIVWQKDLGDQTETVAGAMTVYDPDSTWTPIPAEQ
jgi:hypothetical protein